MKESNQYRTYNVTRQGDSFTCTHGPIGSHTIEPDTRTLRQVSNGANSIIQEFDEMYYALEFIGGLLEKQADSGKGMDETDLRGLSVICSSLASRSVEVSTDWRAEHIIIDKIARGEV